MTLTGEQQKSLINTRLAVNMIKSIEAPKEMENNQQELYGDI